MKDNKFRTKLNKNSKSLKEILNKLSDDRKSLIEKERRYYKLLFVLREQRIGKGLSQQELANRVKIPRTTITKIESGKRNVTVSTLMDIAQAMGKKLVVGLE